MDLNIPTSSVAVFVPVCLLGIVDLRFLYLRFVFNLWVGKRSFFRIINMSSHEDSDQVFNHHEDDGLSMSDGGEFSGLDAHDSGCHGGSHRRSFEVCCS